MRFLHKLRALLRRRTLDLEMAEEMRSRWEMLIVHLVGCFLLLITFVACWLPARPAARVDPMTALRGE